MAEHYYVVGKHGPPTKETAPHGYMYVADGDWKEGVRYGTRMNPLFADDSVWWPLPAPPTEEAPAPEPVKRWTVDESPAMTDGRLICAGNSYLSIKQAHAAADALNALDRDGVVWGPGRPMEELPETGRVLVRHQGGGTYDRGVSFLRDDWGPHWLCWWPLPTRGEAT